jgi:galactitol-specific phosphotransferase system IIC component
MYYGLNPIWWSLVLLAVVNTKGGLDNKLKLGVALIGAGAVVGVLAKNIQEEEKLKKNSILNKKS